MGDASLPKEHILCALPFPRDEKIDKLLSDLASSHPQIEIEYHHISFVHGKSDASSIPDDSWLRTTILVTLASLPSRTSLVPNLKLIHLFSAGANHLSSSPIWRDTTIPITNSSGVHGPQISEWVLLQILSFSHKQKQLLEWQKDRVWGKGIQLGEMQDSVQQRLGVLGYGAIGRQTAKICAAMGMDVVAYTAGPRTTKGSKRDRGYIVPGTGDEEGLIPSEWFSGLDKASLHNFLEQDIDVLLIAVPQTAETTHFLGAAEFAILGRKKALIVNIARGAIVVQDDLITALKEGTLRGAALDVTDPEPLPEDSELWGLENVAITPHISGLGVLYAERSFQILERNLGNLERGKGLMNVVDRRKGY